MSCAACEARRLQLEAEMNATIEAVVRGRPLEAAQSAVQAGATAVIGLAEMVGLKAKKDVTDGAK